MTMFRTVAAKMRNGDSVTGTKPMAKGPAAPHATPAAAPAHPADAPLRCYACQHNPAADTRAPDAHQADGQTPVHQAH